MNDSISAEQIEPVAGLTFGQQQRLTQLLDQYLSGLENGQPVDLQRMMDQNADLQTVLQTYLDKLDGLRGIAPGFQDHGELEPLVSGDATAQVNSLELGDYTIVRELGRGGMGIVYEAVQRSLDRRVALKLLPMASMLDPRQITRFKNESHAAAQLQHPNIVPVYSVGVHRGIHYFAMQFIEGQTVDQWIESTAGQANDWRETVRNVIAVAEALHFAHESGIVHRDIKPSNLMLDQQGQVWVTDFGLARCQNNHSITLSGNLVGTMRYMSPEQATGRAELVDHRTDIYSLGATLYEMLTQQAAFQGDDGPTILNQITNGPPPKIRKLASGLPSDLEVVLQKAMATEKDDRYATAQEFADDLTAVLEHRPTVAKPLSLPTVVYRWAKRHQRLAVAASLAMVLACGLITVGIVINVALFAEKNRDVQASYDRSEIFFSQAQEAVDQLGNRYAAQLASVPGAEHIRQEMLQDTLEYYQQFVAQATGASTDPKLLAQLALTHSRIGSLVSELTSSQAAIVHFQRSAELYQQLWDQDPESTVLRYAISQNLDQLGLAQLAAGQFDPAEQSFQQGIRLQSALLIAVEPHENLRTDLARTQSNLGLLYRQTGRHELARQNLNQAVALFEDAIEVNPQDVLAIRGIAAALGTLSSLTVDSDPKAAIEMLERAVSYQVRIAQDSPAQLRASSEIASTYNGLGSAYLATKQTQKAVDSFAAAVRILRQLRSIAPLVKAHQQDLAMSLTNLASAYQQQQAHGLAQQTAAEAVALQRDCLQADNPESHDRYAIMLSNLGKTQESVGELSAACGTLQLAIEQQSQAIEQDSSSAKYRSQLLQYYSNLLRLQVRTKNYHDAAQTSKQYRQAAAFSSQQLILVAQDLAIVSVDAQEVWRDHAAKEIATTLLAARDIGIDFDPHLLSSEPLRSFVDAPDERRTLKP
jgi:eukaryotic-like serine/threonine-protein kinase